MKRKNGEGLFYQIKLPREHDYPISKSLGSYKDLISSFKSFFHQKFPNINFSLMNKNLSTLKTRNGEEIYFFKKIINPNCTSIEGKYCHTLNLLTINNNKDTTLYHELLHASSTFICDEFILVGFSQRDCANNSHMGYGLNEGTTEYLTTKYFGEDESLGYFVEKNIIAIIDEMLPPNALEKYYFEANLYGLVDELTKKTSLDNICDLIDCLDSYTIIYYKSTTHDEKTDERLMYINRLEEVITKICDDVYKEKFKTNDIQKTLNNNCDKVISSYEELTYVLKEVFNDFRDFVSGKNNKYTVIFQDEPTKIQKLLDTLHLLNIKDPEITITKPNYILDENYSRPYFGSHKEEVINFINVINTSFGSLDLSIMKHNLSSLKVLDLNVLHNLFQKAQTKPLVKTAEYNGITNVIKLYENDKNTLYHELLHASTSVIEDAYEACGFERTYFEHKDIYATSFNEGYTEILAERLSNTNYKNSYFFEKKVVEIIEQVVGKHLMAELYFKADLFNLIKELENYLSFTDINDLFLLLDNHTMRKYYNDDTINEVEEIKRIILKLINKKYQNEEINRKTNDLFDSFIKSSEVKYGKNM